MRKKLKPAETIALIALIGVFICVIFSSEIKKYIDEKIFESTYQFFLLTIIGGGVSLVYESYRRDLESKEREAEKQREEKEQEAKRQQEEKEREAERQREERERRREIQRSLRTRLIVAFNDVKKVRRLLRAEALYGDRDHKNEVVIGEEYKRQMNALIDAQLSIDFAYRVIKYEPDLFQDATLVDKLKGANNYLRDIIGEYEKVYRKFSNESMSIRVDELPKLYDFIRPYDDADEINRVFWDSFYKAFDIIRRVLQS